MKTYRALISLVILSSPECRRVFGNAVRGCDYLLQDIKSSYMELFLQFLKRQDLLNVLARMMRPACDQVVGSIYTYTLTQTHKLELLCCISQ